MTDLRTRWLERAAGHKAQYRELREALAEAKLKADRDSLSIRSERQYAQFRFWDDRAANLRLCPHELRETAVAEAARLRIKADLWTRAAEELAADSAREAQKGEQTNGPTEPQGSEGRTG